MNYKVKRILEKNRKYFITFFVIWILMEILLVSPLAVSISKCTNAPSRKLGAYF